MSKVAPEAVWQDDASFDIGSTRFRASGVATDYLSHDSSPDDFVLAKPRLMIDRLLELRDEEDQWRRIVDIGIFKGGSTAFLALAFQPKRLSAFDLNAKPVPALEAFIDEHGLRDVVRPWYGFDQGDTAALEAAVRADHTGEPLDLVIDDGSHLYPQTRRAFEVLFPRLRPGGRYIIEDWAWAHFDSPTWQHDGGWFHDRPALTNLIVELLLVIGRDDTLISAIDIRHGTAEIVRGPAVRDGSIKLEQQYVNRGLPFRPLL